MAQKTQKHQHHHEIDEKNLLISAVLNFAITIAEIVGGILSNSLALLSDAVHNLGDAFAVLFAYIANKIGKKKANSSKTFGYKRIEILTALLNAVILLTITFYLFYEAVERFVNPSPIKGKLMFVVAFIGLIANVVSVFLLHKDSHKNLNVKAAYLHLVGDTLSSVAVIAGSVLIIYFNWFWIDPLITFGIGIYILIHTWDVLKTALNILMQASPDDVKVKDIKVRLEQIPEIKNVHHIHLWALTQEKIYFEAHIELSADCLISESEAISAKLDQVLFNEFSVSHTTYQFEFQFCKDN